MIHIDNLSGFLARIVLNGDSGTFHPQNMEYVCTTDLVSTIGSVHDNTVPRIGLFNGVIDKLIDQNVTVNKLFGGFSYTKELSVYRDEYCVCGFEESIVETEKK